MISTIALSSALDCCRDGASAWSAAKTAGEAHVEEWGKSGCALAKRFVGAASDPAAAGLAGPVGPVGPAHLAEPVEIWSCVEWEADTVGWD